MKLKKQLCSALLACVLALPAISGFATAEQIIIDGTTVDIPTEMGSIKERDDRTFVPVRFVSEYLGFSVNYNDGQQSVTLNHPEKGAYFISALEYPNNLYYLPDSGEPKLYIMDTLAFIDEDEDRFYLPIRFFAEAIGYTVDWDGGTETVTLTSVAETPAE